MANFNYAIVFNIFQNATKRRFLSLKRTTIVLSFPDRFWFMVFNATFNNISAISWWLILLVEETGVPGENHWPVVIGEFVLLCVYATCIGNCDTEYI